LLRPGRGARAAGAARHDRRDLRHRHPIQERRHACPLALIRCSLRCAAAQVCSVQRATGNGQHATDNMQQTTCNRQHATDNMQRTTCNGQHATGNMQAARREPTHKRQGPHAAVAGRSARVRTTAPPRAQYPCGTPGTVPVRVSAEYSRVPLAGVIASTVQKTPRSSRRLVADASSGFICRRSAD
jgi:hypothetical protein